MMTISGNPDFTIVNRLLKSMPQYHVGHIKMIKEIQQHIKTTYPRFSYRAPFEAVEFTRLHTTRMQLMKY